jgi:hypothetical protein
MLRQPSQQRRSATYGARHALTGIDATSVPNGGSARSYLTLSTLATVLQSQDDTLITG